jgi:hypothetical protein
LKDLRKFNGFYRHFGADHRIGRRGLSVQDRSESECRRHQQDTDKRGRIHEWGKKLNWRGETKLYDTVQKTFPLKSPNPFFPAP